MQKWGILWLIQISDRHLISTFVKIHKEWRLVYKEDSFNDTPSSQFFLYCGYLALPTISPSLAVPLPSAISFYHISLGGLRKKEGKKQIWSSKNAMLVAKATFLLLTSVSFLQINITPQSYPRGWHSYRPNDRLNLYCHRHQQTTSNSCPNHLGVVSCLLTTLFTECLHTDFWPKSLKKQSFSQLIGHRQR